MAKLWRYRLEYGAVCVIQRALTGLPRLWTLKLGRMLGRVAFVLDARGRRNAFANLEYSDLGLSQKEQKRMLRACYGHFGAAVLANLRWLRLPPQSLLAWVHLEGAEHLEALKGKAYIQFTAHYGNWESAALVQSLQGYPLAVVTQTVKNPYFNQYIHELRTKLGNRIIPREGALKGILRCLREGVGVGYLVDQDAREQGIWVRFLGQWVKAFPAAASLALKTGVPLLPIFSWPNSDGSLTVKVDPPHHPRKSGDHDRDVWVATQWMLSRIEAQIRRDPRWWHWMYRHFRTRPGPEEILPPPYVRPEDLEAAKYFLRESSDH